jgi:hypothetical protein
MIRVTRISEVGMLVVTANWSKLQFAVSANVAPSYLILFTLKVEALHSSGTSVLTRATRRHIPEMAFFIL